jgi:transposase-like protein
VPPRLPDDKRAAILADIKAGRLGNRETARKHGVAPATVTKIAKDSDLLGAFERSQTKSATRAVIADSRSRRAQMASDLLDDAERLRTRAWSAYSYYERAQFGPELVTLDLPPLKEVKDAYVSLGVALDKHVVLERLDSGQNDAATSLLGAVAEGLQAAYDAARGAAQAGPFSE